MKYSILIRTNSGYPASTDLEHRCETAAGRICFSAAIVTTLQMLDSLPEDRLIIKNHQSQATMLSLA